MLDMAAAQAQGHVAGIHETANACLPRESCMESPAASARPTFHLNGTHARNHRSDLYALLNACIVWPCIHGTYSAAGTCMALPSRCSSGRVDEPPISSLRRGPRTAMYTSQVLLDLVVGRRIDRRHSDRIRVWDTLQPPIIVRSGYERRHRLARRGAHHSGEGACR